MPKSKHFLQGYSQTVNFKFDWRIIQFKAVYTRRYTSAI